MKANSASAMRLDYPEESPTGAPFDPPPKDTHLSAVPDPPADLTTHQYKTIGTTLMAAECARLEVGVPLRLPSKTTRSLKAQVDETIPEFIRYSLLGVSTNTLESYCDDLEGSILEIEDSTRRELFIDDLSFLDRYFFTLCIFVVICSICLLGLSLLGFDREFAAIMAALTAAVAALGGTLASQESTRRSSLHAALYSELLRRQGLDESGESKIRLMTVKPN